MKARFSAYIGFDSRQPVAFQVMAHSIWNRCSHPIPVSRLTLAGLPITRRGLTEFTFSRFLVPWLNEFDGYSLFVDSDMIALADIVEMLAFPLAYPEQAVWVVKNEQKFEWPSLMLFNNALCQKLTPEFVDNKSNNLYSFEWAEGKIGELPADWNHLVGYDPPNPKAKIVHFTKGIPCWPETEMCEYADEWKAEFQNMRSSVSFQELMGNSVHVRRPQKHVEMIV